MWWTYLWYFYWSVVTLNIAITLAYFLRQKVFKDTVKAKPNRNGNNVTFNPIVDKIEPEEHPSSSSEGPVYSELLSEASEIELEQLDTSGAEFEADNRADINILTRKPRKKCKKIRFEALGVNEEQMKEILAAGNKAKELHSEKPDEGILLSFQVENHEKKQKAPSMWDYNPDVVPEEFIVVEHKELPMVQKNRKFCLPPDNVFVRICSMLTPLEFVELSLTCRFIHWKMFTTCTCYAPYTVRMEIIDEKLTEGVEKYKTAPKIVFYAGEQRGFFVLQPSCLKKPFFFDTLELSLQMDTGSYPIIIDYVLPVRKLAKRLKLIHYKGPLVEEINLEGPRRLFQELNVNAFRVWYDISRPGIHDFFNGIEAEVTKNMWKLIRSYRQMHEACIPSPPEDPKELLLLENRIGIYGSPCLFAIPHVLGQFASGSKKLEFHAYINIDYYNPILRFFYVGVDDCVPEYYSERYGSFFIEESETNCARVYKKDGEAIVMLGLKKTFLKNQRHYRRLRRNAEKDPAEDDTDEEEYPDDFDDDLGDKCWRMYLAISGDEDYRQGQEKREKYLLARKRKYG